MLTKMAAFFFTSLCTAMMIKVYAHIRVYCSIIFAERLAKLSDVETKWEAKKAVLDRELEKMEKLLAITFDR